MHIDENESSLLKEIQIFSIKISTNKYERENKS